MTSPGVWLYRGWKPACVVLAGGDLGCAAVLREEIEMGESFVACADSGADYLDELSLKARLWMGDGDSVRRMPPEAESHRYPVEKDETDLELVLAEIARRRLVPVALLGALGGRLDHELANLHLAGAFRRNHGPIALYGPACRVRFVLPGQPEVLAAEPRYPIVSLLALGGEAEGVATEGLRWNLAAEPLSPWRARGLSNRLLAARAVVSLRAGTLAIVEGGDWRPSDAPPVREV